MSILKVDDIQTTAGLPNRGKILQVVQIVKTDVASGLSGGVTWYDTGLSIDITPSTTASKILIMSDVFLSSSSGYAVKAKLVRGSSDIYVGAGAGNRPRVSKQFTSSYGGGDNYNLYNGQGIPIMYVDSPSTASQVTYKIQMASYNTSYTVYINRSGFDNDPSDGRCASSLIAMEIAV